MTVAGDKKRRLKAKAKAPAGLGSFTARLLAEQERLAKLLPEMDPDELNLVLISLLTPIEERLVFLRPSGDGHGF